MKTRYLAIALALVLAAGAVTAVWAHARAGGTHGMMFGHHMGWIAHKLDLSDAQKAQIQSMIQAERPNFEPLVKQLAANHQQMLVATRGGSFDEAQVRTLAKQQAHTLAELMVIRERLIAKAYNTVLTPDQKTKADTLRQHMLDRMSKRFQEQTNQPTTTTNQ
ncbi:MAG TPA: Spy/CpxP family protein refolding chaperone [Terriglobales bacterium]|nr:Spy/CpxP family protein refolding chaperone [Terriglobales bacterium]